ncbi:MAG: glutamate synthase [Proteobacteria bacterium]|jgi:NAD(P)H-dependent glutamate synthase small subunit|nr:glutamate synthase [Pseudomonadota bacterium]MBP09769.1 glutamate synthase [Acidiferrobacteraceae bacterium]HCF74268.1 glutamate synthase [Gammaproteobacteria bacterium]HJP11732.1 glutamate synthase subunit beta [Arenicellales bacterium]|tara:strand:- start:23096 stop:24628 length:1533 start_codon:yes stop_codon:yes gene_type:complete
MAKLTSFREIDRAAVPYRAPLERLDDFDEILTSVGDIHLQDQGARCMDCGVPFCQSVDGCPVDNLIPEWNDQVYQGKWRAALERLQQTNNFPEFTGRVCPAPCEGACVLGIIEPAVTIKNIENAIVDRGFAEGWVVARPPAARSGKTVGVVGSGPAGLAAADQLNKAGHRVTVYERADRIGGLLMYGIPNMKLDKLVVNRRVDLLRQEGVEFLTGVNIGSSKEYPNGHIVSIMAQQGVPVKHLDVAELLDQHDALLLATGATVPRDLPIPGRDLTGVHFAMDYLTRNTQSLLATGSFEGAAISARDKRVIVIGGGDTGADCIATALRQGCREMVNFELLDRPPDQRAVNNPWPEWPLIYRTEYAHVESASRFGGDPRQFALLTREFIDDGRGHLAGVKTVRVDWSSRSGKAPFSEIPGSEEFWECDLVLLSLGFLGPEHEIPERLKITCDERSNYQVAHGKFVTELPRVFAAGDCRRGQSLVVWAINEGRGAARAIDAFLAGPGGLAVSG